MVKMVRKWTWAAALGFVSLAASQHAEAQARHTSVVLWAEGSDKELALTQANAALGALGGDYGVVEGGEWQKALAQQGQRGALAPLLKDPKKRSHLLDQVRAAGRAVHADDVVLVVTRRTKGGAVSAVLLVVDPSADDAPSETRLALTRDGDTLGHAVHDALVKTHLPSADSPPSASEATPASPSPAPGSNEPPSATQPVALASQPESDTSANGASVPPSHWVGANLFEISVGGGAEMRNFQYSDVLSQNLQNYQLNAAPMATAEGELYPLTGLRTPVLSDLGIVGGYARALALQSASSDGVKVDTQWFRYYVGARLRARMGSGTSPVLGLAGVYGDEAFTFQGATIAALPSVAYHTVRVSGDVRVPLGRAAVFADGGYLFVLSAGDVAGLFPKSSVGGFEAQVGAALTITSGWEARLSAHYLRFFYAMNSRPGDPYVSGGALDQFGGLQASLAYVY
jgi:hypothetical protein